MNPDYTIYEAALLEGAQLQFGLLSDDQSADPSDEWLRSYMRCLRLAWFVGMAAWSEVPQTMDAAREKVASDSED